MFFSTYVITSYSIHYTKLYDVGDTYIIEDSGDGTIKFLPIGGE